MKPVYRGMVVAVAQCAIVLSLAGKYAIDRERLPRVWASAVPVDPNLPVRGRYVSLQLKVDYPEAGTNQLFAFARFSIQNDRLAAAPAETNGVMISRLQGRPWAINEPVAFFIPEHVREPSLRAPGEELWVEVSVPKSGAPRPLRLAVKKNGVLTPLDLR